jgi:hypothetical protein
MRPITSFTLRTVAIVLAALACAISALAESGRPRLAEARVIVALELAGEKTLAPCQIDAEAWMDYAVPADLARRYLGAHAIASPAPPPASPRAALDPRGARPEIFCSREDSRAQRDAAIAALRPGERTTQVTLGYTFPVFDAAARTAIIIVEHEVTTWHGDDDGSWIWPSGEIFGVAHVYKKRGKRWDGIATEEVRGSMRELIDDGVTGFLVDSLDAAVDAIARSTRSIAPLAVPRCLRASRSTSWRIDIWACIDRSWDESRGHRNPGVRSASFLLPSSLESATKA